jgi:hypothetical protein
MLKCALCGEPPDTPNPCPCCDVAQTTGPSQADIRAQQDHKVQQFPQSVSSQPIEEVD